MRQIARLLALLSFAGFGLGAARAAELPLGLGNLAAQVMPAVVSIAAMAPLTSAPPADASQDGGETGGDSSALRTADTTENTSGSLVPPPKTIESLGSGFVFDPAGYILTNNHVIDGASAVTVTFPDGAVYDATIAGRDKDADLAVLKIDAGHRLPFLKFGDSGKMRVGDWVMAIGNPFGLPGSTSAGIISALHRVIGDTSFDDFIQTDAAINRGNSGGPLFNLAGEVIGVNSAIESPNGDSDGIGFAIPSAMAAPVARALAHTGAMQRGWLGVATEEVTPQVQAVLTLPDTKGALVGAVAPNGPSAGVLDTGDVIVGLDGVAVDNPRALLIRTAEIPAGKTVVVRFYRDGGIGQADVTVTAPPPPLDESLILPPPPPAAPVILSALGLGLAGKPAVQGVVSGVSVMSATGAAAKAGIVAGDVIEQVNGLTVADAGALQARVTALGNAPPVFLVDGNAADGTNPGPRWIAVPGG
ncbi:trypsin-like peptidase domain-containing protein [Acidocella sp.]|uniref:trypsin-like peptidase domain-containing protein n=1 Tax=Acidocella sp. TaxID=50710 RepID=UPI00261A45C2|nr:trypsin-like peptidase domain-containing protein [Acidocella sp.]